MQNSPLADSPAPAYIADALAHAGREYPHESCGLVVSRRGRAVYLPCRNLAENPGQQFELDPECYAGAEDSGQIVAIVHSHVDVPPVPSQADRVGCEASGLPWVIVNAKTGAWTRFEPEGYVAPLLGREFVHGVLDCYSLVRDYYARECGIALADYPRGWQWWDGGQDLYRENFEREGFARIPLEDLKAHDALLLHLQSDVPNHAAVYLGNGQIMHHVFGRLSTRDVYGGYWRKATHCALRHGSLM